MRKNPREDPSGTRGGPRARARAFDSRALAGNATRRCIYACDVCVCACVCVKGDSRRFPPLRVRHIAGGPCAIALFYGIFSTRRLRYRVSSIREERVREIGRRDTKSEREGDADHRRRWTTKFARDTSKHALSSLGYSRASAVTQRCRIAFLPFSYVEGGIVSRTKKEESASNRVDF